jgi:hypothetical protein
MIRKFVPLLAGLAVAASLAACETATPYQPNVPGASGGFSDQRLEANRFRVSFSGNELTSRETVEGYLLYRAAELTVAQGFDTFSVVDRHTDRDSRTYVEPDPLYHPWGPGFGYWRPSWRYYGHYGHRVGWRSWDPFWGDPFWGDRVDVQTVQKFEATAEIIMSHGPKDPKDARSFDAHAVMANLGPRIQRPPPPKA